MTGTSIQEAGQFAGDAPLTGHHIQGHSINVILAKGVPEEVLRSSVTHFGTRGLFGKPIRRTSQHDRDNVRRKRWRVAQSSKPKVKPKPISQFDDNEGRDHQGGSGCNKGVPPPAHGATESMNMVEKRIPHPLPPTIPSLLPNNVKSSSSPPYSTHTHRHTGGVLTYQAYSRPEDLPGLASEGAHSTSPDCHSHVLPLPVTSVDQVGRTLRSSGIHTPSTVAVEYMYMNTVPSVVLETPHASGNAVARVPDPLSHPPPSQPATTSPPDRRTYNPTMMVAANWTATHQERHSKHLYVPAAAVSSALRCHQWREPGDKGSESTTTTGAQRVCGPVRATRATFYQHAPSPYPNHSHRSAAGRARLSRSSAENSTAAQCVSYGIMPPVASTTGAHHARQHDRTPIPAHSPYNSTRHLSTRTSPSRTHTVRTSPTPRPNLSPVPYVNFVNQHRVSTPTTMNAQQRSQSSRTSASTYSELAHALVDHHSVTPSTTQTAVSGVNVQQAPLYAPQVRGGLIACPAMSVPDSESLAWHSCWQNDLPIVPQPMLNYLPTGRVLDAALSPGTSRTHGTDDGHAMTRNFEGRFEDCEPFWPNIMAPLHSTNLARGQGSIDETDLEAPSIGSQSDIHQQPLATSTRSGAQKLYYPYTHPAQVQPASASTQGSSW